MNCVRSGDAAARFGGEEFAAFLLDAEIGQAMVAAERIRNDDRTNGIQCDPSGHGRSRPIM